MAVADTPGMQPIYIFAAARLKVEGILPTAFCDTMTEEDASSLICSYVCLNVARIGRRITQHRRYAFAMLRDNAWGVS